MIKEFKKGDIVIVSDDLSRTYSMYGGSQNDYMEKMKNRIFPIHKARANNSYEIYNDEANFYYRFDHRDLCPYEEEKIKEEIVVFDIKYLDI